jgi:hypothetical protein
LPEDTLEIDITNQKDTKLEYKVGNENFNLEEIVQVNDNTTDSRQTDIFVSTFFKILAICIPLVYIGRFIFIEVYRKKRYKIWKNKFNKKFKRSSD